MQCSGLHGDFLDCEVDASSRVSCLSTSFPVWNLWGSLENPNKDSQEFPRQSCGQSLGNVLGTPRAPINPCATWPAWTFLAESVTWAPNSLHGAFTNEMTGALGIPRDCPGWIPWGMPGNPKGFSRDPQGFQKGSDNSLRNSLRIPKREP